jgi:hypothetical protein
MSNKMKDDILYSDKLIEIRNDLIKFYKYYITFTGKVVRFDEVEKIIMEKPTVLTGKYRYWGTGDFNHWFPLDLRRSSRKIIFIMHRKYKKIRIGFSVENEDKVIEI